MCTLNQRGQHPCFDFGHGRRFFTKEERIEELEKYKEQLQKEIDGIKEYIKEQTK